MLNKIDLPGADCDRVIREIEDIIGLDCSNILKVGAQVQLHCLQQHERGGSCWHVRGTCSPGSTVMWNQGLCTCRVALGAPGTGGIMCAFTQRKAWHKHSHAGQRLLPHFDRVISCSASSPASMALHWQPHTTHRPPPTTHATQVSAKMGIGIAETLEAIVERVPPPHNTIDKPLRALIFDSYYDPYRGVVCQFRVMDGCVSALGQLGMGFWCTCISPALEGSLKYSDAGAEAAEVLATVLS